MLTLPSSERRERMPKWLYLPLAHVAALHVCSDYQRMQYCMQSYLRMDHLASGAWQVLMLCLLPMVWQQGVQNR